MLSKMRACIAGAYVLAHVVMRHYARTLGRRGWLPGVMLLR